MKILSQIDWKAQAYKLLLTLQQRELECGKCATIFIPETIDDITIRQYDRLHASCDCPVCGLPYEVLSDEMTLLAIRNEQGSKAYIYEPTSN